jgi:aspartate racemase
MKIIGLIGGMSWESTIPYYRQINELIKERMGGLHSARIILYSVDFHDIERLQHAGDWEAAGRLLGDAARRLEGAGADFLVLCTNTMHKVAAAIESAVRIPLLHIADPTAAAVKAAGFSTVGLLGTRFTMEESFYKERLQDRYGVRTMTPASDDCQIIHHIIFEELCLGLTCDESRNEFRRVIQGLVHRGAQAVVLGCTEISLLVDQRDCEVPLFDTTRIHARKAGECALA